MPNHIAEQLDIHVNRPRHPADRIVRDRQVRRERRPLIRAQLIQPFDVPGIEDEQRVSTVGVSLRQIE